MARQAAPPVSSALAGAAAGGPLTVKAAGNAEVAIAKRAFRQIWIGMTACALTFAATVASTAVTYASTYPTAESRKVVAAATSSDTGLKILLGPVSAVDTVGGYTVYKVFVFLTTIGAIWALLAATRLFRGEEDAGRWQLVLAGSTSVTRAALATLASLGAAVAVIFLAVLASTLMIGRKPELGLDLMGTFLYSASLVVAPAVFIAVGALTSQLARTRRLATGLGLGIFGATFVLRMLADAGPSTHWISWTTPFGWIELMAPFTQNNAWPLIPTVLSIAGLSIASLILASRRDAGVGILTSHDRTQLRPFGLSSALGLSARLDLAVLGAWCAGAVASGFALGMIAKITTVAVPSSIDTALQKFGVQGSFTKQYFSIAFIFIAVVAALIPASQLGAAGEEETSGRLVQIVTSPVSRSAWIGGRLALTAAAIVAAGILGSFGAWLGAVSQGVSLDLPQLLLAGVNVVPIALVSLGIGAVVFSLAPRFAARAVYVVIIWSALAYILGPIVFHADWMTRVSLFHYMALAPANNPQVSTLALTTAVAAALCGVAVLLFKHRDIHSI